jgi:hypothetical protein
VYDGPSRDRCFRRSVHPGGWGRSPFTATRRTCSCQAEGGKETSAPAEPAAAPKEKVEEPAAAPAPDLEEVARRRAEQAKQDQLHGLEPEAIVREWLSALAEKQKDAASADNQQALSAAAGQFASVFLTKCPAGSSRLRHPRRAGLRPARQVSRVVDLAGRTARSARISMAYIRSKVLKLAETFEMHPVDRDEAREARGERVEGSLDPRREVTPERPQPACNLGAGALQ